MRNLDPKTTYIVDADRKGLSWKGWKKQYNSEAKNYAQTSDISKIKAIIEGVSQKKIEIKTVVIDTLNTILVDKEIEDMKKKGYDKWIDIATSVWELISEAHLLREDLTIIFLAHTQTDRDENGFMFTRIKTSGKKLDKIVLESKFTTVLIAKCIDGKHIFETQSKNSTAKSPMGCFESSEIENDITIVLKALEDY